MKRMSRLRTPVAVVLLSCFSFAAVGCDEDIASQMAAITGTYLGDSIASVGRYFGDMVSVLVAGHLRAALGLDVSGVADGNEDGHTHESGPLHDYEH